MPPPACSSEPQAGRHRQSAISSAPWPNNQQNGFVRVQPQAISPVMEVIFISCFLLLKWS